MGDNRLGSVPSPAMGWLGHLGLFLCISSPNQREQYSPLQSALRCELAADEELIIHPRQPSPSCPPTPPPTFGSQHSGQHFSHPKKSALPFSPGTGCCRCVCPGAAGSPPSMHVQTATLIKSPGCVCPVSPAVNVCIDGPRLRM